MSSKLETPLKQHCMFRHAKVGIAICDMDTNCIENVNSIFTSIFEKDEKDIIGKPIDTIFPIDENLYLTDFNSSKLANIGDFSFETKYAKEIGIIQLFVHFTIIDNKQLLVHIIDLSSNQCSRDELLTLTENLPGFAYKYQEQTSTSKEKFLYVSKGVKDIYGISINEALQDISLIRKLIHPEDMPSFQKAIEHSSKTLTLFHQKFRINHPQKGLIWLETKSTPKKDFKNENLIWHGITVDITEEKKTEEKLKMSEKKYRTLVENAKIPIYRFDKNFKRLYVNSEVEKLVGKTQEELIGKTPFEVKLIEDDSIDDLKKALTKVVKTKDTTSVELKFILPNNTRKYFMHNLIPEFNHEGEVESILAISVDLTAQKELAKKEQEFRSLAENLPDNVIRWDKNGNYLYINPTHEQTLGVKAEEVLGKSIKVLFPHHTEVIGAIEKIQRQESDSVVVRQSLPTINGTMEVHEVKLIGEKNEKGELQSILGIGRDMTQPIELQEALQKSEKHYRNNASLLNSVLESSQDVIIFALDREYKYLTFNQSHLKIMKSIWDCEVAVGMNMLDCITCSEDWKHAKALFDRALEGESFVDEAQYGDEELSRSYWETHYSPIFSNDNKEIIGFTCYNINVTEQKLMKNALASKEREFRSLTENLPDNIARWDKDGNYLYLNPVHEQTLGVKAEDILGKSIKVLFPNHTEVIKAIEKVQNMDNNPIIVRQFASVNGTMAVHEVKVTAEKDEQGKLISILGIGRDISQIVATQEELTQAIELRRGIINSIPDLLFEVHRSGKYLNFWFHDKEMMASYRKRLIGKNIKDVLLHQAAEIAFEALEEAHKNGISLGKKYSIKENDTIKWYELSVSKKSDGNFLVLAHDITTQVKMQEDIANSEAQFRTITEHTPDTIARYDYNCVRTYANPAFSNISGKDIKELLGKKPTHYYNSSDAIAYEEIIKRVITTGIEEDFEYSWPDKDKNKITSYIRLVPERDSLGNIESVLATGRDITKLKKYEEEITKQKDFHDTLLKGIAKSGMSIAVVEDGKYIYTNNLELAIEYGYDENVMENKPSFLETIHPDDKEKVMQMYEKRLAGEAVPNTYTITQVNKKGEEREHEVSVVLIPNTTPIQTLVVTKDITEQKNIEKRIEFMAHHDILTKLPNRILAKDRTEQLLARAKRTEEKLAILYIDLDGFKNINDTLGHTFGDEVLKLVASRFKAVIRATDIISRQGGDEFLVSLPDINNENEVMFIANKLIDSLKKSFVINNHTLSISASIGISFYPSHADSYERLLQCADAAMYKAKENGKNTYCVFTQKMQHNLIGLFKMQNDLKDAIKNKEFILHYQPQVDIHKNEIIGVEALIRWEHPLLGMVPPLNFISVAESMGLIVEIGEWVLIEACKQAAAWAKKGRKIFVAVNISAIQFKRGNLIDAVKYALNVSGLEARYLELELTESILINDTESVLQTVKAIKELGVQLSIDDFGTGYSSLSYLKRFAVDKLKIDQSFIKEILIDKDDEVIVKTIIQMAKSFNLKSIAEGVENKEILDLLRGFGCEEVQGYYFAKPMANKDFDEYCENGFKEFKKEQINYDLEDYGR